MVFEKANGSANEKSSDSVERHIVDTKIRNEIQIALIKEIFGEEGEETDPEYNKRVIPWIAENRQRISDAIETDPEIEKRWLSEPEKVLEELR